MIKPPADQKNTDHPQGDDDRSATPVRWKPTPLCCLVAELGHQLGRDETDHEEDAEWNDHEVIR